MTTINTVLSGCGGFITRRNSHIQARNELKLKTNCSLVSSGHFANFSDQQQQQELLQSESRITVTTTTTTAVATTPTHITNNCCRVEMHQHSKALPTVNFWVLGALLLIVSTSLPSSTYASPRRMHGHNLILPHRHHVHHRSADQQNKFPFALVLSENCTKSKMNLTLEKVQKALKVNNDTRNEIAEILDKWLGTTSRTRDSAVEEYILHYLELEYPLHEEVKNKAYDGADTTLTETELQKILVSLNIIHDLTNHVIRNQSRSDYRDFLCYVPEKILHNKVEVRDMLADVTGCELVPDYRYNTKHTNLVFAVLNETVALLEVIEKKFHVMSEQLNRKHTG